MELLVHRWVNWLRVWSSPAQTPPLASGDSGSSQWAQHGSIRNEGDVPWIAGFVQLRSMLRLQLELPIRGTTRGHGLVRVG